MSFPTNADVLVNCMPANCMPSPESPQKSNRGGLDGYNTFGRPRRNLRLRVTNHFSPYEV